MGRHITQVDTGQLVYRARRVQTLPHGHGHHHHHQCSDTEDHQQTVTVTTVTLTRSSPMTVCRPPVTRGIIVVVLPNLALEAGNLQLWCSRGLGLGLGLLRPGLEDVTRPAGALPMW